ncbi:ShlB/FhaC/HecB family hemolysin secretion/activation protein [Caenimonas terrae]|uniref:ShlB/FhaC/HecB family hemolysin secretion/activation protein n=1 Tax=Caenimonas terrae TaxID=696074 RepID=A0ABW0NMY7_9BURK
MSPIRIFPLALLALAQAALAQQPPSAGGQLQQIPPAPPAPRAPPEIRIQQPDAPASAAADQARIKVGALRVSGSRVYSEPELVAIAGFRPGSELSLSELREMAARITAHYRSHGYFVALAYLPQQQIRDNVVTIAVSEGQYRNVTVNNTSNLSDRVVRGGLAGIGSGDPILLEPLETRLLVLSDLPGVKVRSTLVPGESVGTSDLLVDVTPGNRISGSVDADNAGNPYTGQWRVGATLNVNNPLGLGDVAGLRVLTSGEGLKYARASYQLQLGRGQVGVAYSKLDYRLGKEFESLGAHGTAEIASAFARYPLLRSRNASLYAQLGYDAKRFQDRIDAVPSVTDKRAQVWTASLYGDQTDSLGGGGQTAYGLSLSSGTIDIQTPGALAVDAATARSNGRFNKLAFNASRSQSLGGPFSLYGAINGQLGSKNLDVSEKMELGGMYAVRAYPEGEAYADEGYVVTVEGRMLLPRFSPGQPGSLQAVAFVDAGSVRTNHTPWSAGDNRRTLSGAGVGLVWSDPGNFTVRGYYAHKLGSEKAMSSPDRSGRFWVQGVKYF